MAVRASDLTRVCTSATHSASMRTPMNQSFMGQGEPIQAVFSRWYVHGSSGRQRRRRHPGVKLLEACLHTRRQMCVNRRSVRPDAVGKCGAHHCTTAMKDAVHKNRMQSTCRTSCCTGQCREPPARKSCCPAVRHAKSALHNCPQTRRAGVWVAMGEQNPPGCCAQSRGWSCPASAARCPSAAMRRPPSRFPSAPARAMQKLGL